MKKLLRSFLLFLIFISYKSEAQIPIIKAKLNYFDVDILGNIYVVKQNELIKYNSKLQQQSTFTNLSLGDISSIDASDAMNLLVFYEDFAKILFLDNTLSIKNSVVDLVEIGFPNTSLACLSYNNGFWIFDPVNQELIRISQFLEVMERSGNLNQVINTEIEPDQLFESGNNVYLKDRKEGVFIFDRYAGYLKRMPFVDIDDLQLTQSNVLSFLKNDTLFTYDMRTLNSDTLLLHKKNIKKIKMQPSNTYYLGDDGVLYADKIQVKAN